MSGESIKEFRPPERKTRLDVWQRGCNELCSLLGRIGKLENRAGKMIIFGNDEESKDAIALEFVKFGDDIISIERCLSGKGETKLSEEEKAVVERLLYITWQSLLNLSNKIGGSDQEKNRKWARTEAEHILKILEDNFVQPYFVED